MHIQFAPKQQVLKTLRLTAKEFFPLVILEQDEWNDFSFCTLCHAHFVAKLGGDVERLGRVRVMFRDQRPDGVWSMAGLSGPIKKFPSRFCSLSDDVEYYRNIASLKRISRKLLTSMRDAAFDRAIWNEFADENAFKTSLMRSTASAIKARDAVWDFFGGGKPVRKFQYRGNDDTALDANFDFHSFKGLPHRIMLLVGPNGAGKTRLMANLAITLSGATRGHNSDEALALRTKSGAVNPLPSFYAVAAVSFNPFDAFEIPSPSSDAYYEYTYLGLRDQNGEMKSTAALGNDIGALLTSMPQQRRARAQAAIRRLMPNFQGEVEDYSILSAGQKIVVNIVVHLLSTLKEGTLILLDEPETHLHPSLLLALLTEISQLVEEYDCYAVIASHSPLVAQQVPSRYVRVIRTDEWGSTVHRPGIECLGASISQLSAELFESAEHRRDYTHVFDELLRKHGGSLKALKKIFPGGLSQNAIMYAASAAELQDLEEQ